MPAGGGSYLFSALASGNRVQCCQNVDELLQVNDDVFVAKGYEHIWASSGQRLKWAFCGCLIDVEASAYVRTASYAPDIYSTNVWEWTESTESTVLFIGSSSQVFWHGGGCGG